MPMMKQIVCVLLVLLAVVRVARSGNGKVVLEATGDTAEGKQMQVPYLNKRDECDTAGAPESKFLFVPFSAGAEAIYLVETLFAPEWYHVGRVLVYHGSFESANPCTNLNMSLTLDVGNSFRQAMLLEKGDHVFVVTGVERDKKNSNTTGEGAFALRIGAAHEGGIAYEDHPRTLFWRPPVLDHKDGYNCSHDGNSTVYLGHSWSVEETAAYDVAVWLTGTPSPTVHSAVYIFEGTLNKNAPSACAPGIKFHDAHESVGHFNDWATVLLKNTSYTIVVVYTFEKKPTEVPLFYGIQVARSDRYTTNTSYAPYNVIEDTEADPSNCTESGVVNKYQYLPFTAQYPIYFFDFFDAFDGNHTVMSVYSGHIGGSPTTPPATCDNWLGSTRSFDVEPWRAHSLWLRLTVGDNYTVIVSSQTPNTVGMFRPAIFSGPPATPRPTTTGHHETTSGTTTTGTTSTTTGTTSGATSGHRTTTAAAATTTTAATTGSTTGTQMPHHHHGMQGWQVALIVVGALAAAGVVVGALAYYLLVVRKRPQYELIN